MNLRFPWMLSVCVLTCAPLMMSQAEYVGADEIPVAAIEHDGPVDFQREVLPILRKSCLACHNSTDAEGDLILESPEEMLKGGSEGPSIIKGDGEGSYLFELASHRVEPVMPPEGNDVEAPNLTGEELALLKLWIDQGAEGSAANGTNVTFEKLPAGINPVYGLALSTDGQTLAAARANQIFIYDLPSQRTVERLTDHNLIEQGLYENPGVAHLDLVQSLAFSPDREWLASAGFRNVKLWKRQPIGVVKDVELGEEIRALTSDAEGSRVAVLLASGAIKFVDSSTGEFVHEMPAIEGATSIELSPHGTLLAAVAGDRVEMWQVDPPSKIAAGEFEAGVAKIQWRSEEEGLAVAGRDHVIRLVDEAETENVDDVAGWLEKGMLKGHQAPVRVIRRLADGAGLVSADESGNIIHWNLEASAPLRTMNHGAPVYDLAVAEADQRLMSFGGGRNARSWNLADGKQVGTKTGDFQLEVASVRAKLASDLSNRLLDLAKSDLDEAQKTKTAEEENVKKAQEALTKATEEQAAKKKAADDSEANRVATEKAMADKQSQLDQVTQGIEASEKERVAAEAEVKTLSEQMTTLQKELEQKMADAKQAGEKLAAAQAKMQEAQSKKQEMEKSLPAIQQELKTAQDANKASTDAAQKAKDELVAADRSLTGAQRTSERAAEASKRAAEAVPMREQEVVSAEELQKQKQQEAEATKKSFEGAQDDYTAATYIAANRVVASLSGRQLTVWSPGLGTPMYGEPLPGDCLPELVSDAAGFVWVASGSHLWRVSTAERWLLAKTIGNVKGESPFSDRVTALAFSPDGRLLAAGGGVPSRSGEISIWDVESAAQVHALKDPHSDVVLGLQFSPDGKTLASAATDRFMKTFDVETGELIRGFEGHTHHVQSVGWSLDGRTLITGGSDQVVKVWNAQTGDQIRTINGFGKELTGVRVLGLSREVAVSSGDRRVHVKNFDNGGNVRQLGGFPDYVYAVETSFDGNLIIGAGQDSVVRVWQRDGKAIAEFAPPSE